MAVCMSADGAVHGLGCDPREMAGGLIEAVDPELAGGDVCGGASSSTDFVPRAAGGGGGDPDMEAWSSWQPHEGFAAEGAEESASAYAAWLMAAAEEGARYQQLWQDFGAWAVGDDGEGASAGADGGAWPPQLQPGVDPAALWPFAHGERRASAAAAAAAAAARPKRRFCVSFPNVGACRRGTACTFAHTRDEIQTPLLDINEEQQEPSSLTDKFFLERYKTLWCPFGAQHEWHNCVYAHNYQDARRPVSIGYGPRLCPWWGKKATGSEYSQRCPLGMRCPHSHGAKEQLYHPHFFKTAICRDLHGKDCPRHPLCAFWHSRAERRKAPPDDVDYSKPLPAEALPSEWVAEFTQLPFLPDPQRGRPEDASLGEWDADAHCAAAFAQAQQQALEAGQAFGAAGMEDAPWSTGCWGLHGLQPGDDVQSAAWFHNSA